MSSPNASHIASLLKEFGRRAMLYGGNPHRAKAYLRAADSVAMLTEPIGDLIARNRLREIPGVGEAIAGVITTLVETGSHPSLEKMRADVPDSVLEMLTISGLRPEKVLKLHKELGIDTIDELEAAAKQDRLKSVKGLIVGYDNIQFTKAPNVLRGMGLGHLTKNAKAMKELTEKCMAPN